MTIDNDHAILSDINFEARKSGLRQDKDGEFVVSFKIHPDDLPTVLLKASYGTRYQVGMVEVGDDEKPANRRSELTVIETEAIEISPLDRAKDRSLISEARRRYRNAPEADQAIADAHIYAKDPRFLEWSGVNTEKEALEYIHTECDVASCREFREDRRALAAFDKLIRLPYLEATNRVAERR